MRYNVSDNPATGERLTMSKTQDPSLGVHRVVLRPHVSSWVKWFDAQPSDDKRTIALAAIERLMNEGKISFWADDLVDKWGNEIPEDLSMADSPEEHLYWNDEHKEDLRIPF